MQARRCTAFAPGRVNVIGEHTDYNDGLALPFAIAEGVTVRAAALDESRGEALIEAIATDLDERDSFALAGPSPADGWRAYVRGAVAELTAAGHALVPARLEISGRVPHGSGLSSSAALTVALCLALIELGEHEGDGTGGAGGTGAGEAVHGDAAHNGLSAPERIALAQLCSRVENEWAGAQTGLLDQLASLFGAADEAVCIDFQSLDVEPVPLVLHGWRFAIADSGERHAHASSGYNERRRECAAACAELGIESLREASLDDVAALPEPLERRARHVLEENARVLEAIDALRAGAIAEVADLLNASHASLRDLYQVSTPAVEATVERLLRAGAAGARLIGGGFGGSVLTLLEPDVALPADSIEVMPGPGAHILAR